MGLKETLSKVATFAVLAYLVVGIWDATNIKQGDIPIVDNMMAAVDHRDFGYMMNVIKMGWGWNSITPVFPVERLPPLLGWYGFYYSIFLPYGYIAIPGFEILIFVLITFLVALIAGLILRSNMNQNDKHIPKKVWLLIPVLLLVFYPLWIWVNFQLFVSGASAVFSMSSAEAVNVYIEFGKNTQNLTWVFLIMTALGLWKVADITKNRL